MDTALLPLLDERLMLEENGFYLSLAVPLGDDYFPPPDLWNRLNEVPEHLGRLTN